MGIVYLFEGANEMSDSEKKDNLIGSLWLKDYGDKKYLSGVVGGKRVFVYKNRNKKNEKSPDYFVFAKEDSEDVQF